MDYYDVTDKEGADLILNDNHFAVSKVDPELGSD